METTSGDEAELLDVAVEAARRAGSLLLDGRGRARQIETKSSPTDMVSEMDRAAEALIRTVLAERRPGDAILGEEGGELAGDTGVRWIVDPLDGTTNFLYGFPAWSVSVAAERGAVVVVGAVFDPTHDELWTAQRGRGAYCNAAPLPPLADRGGAATALVATGFSYLPAERETHGQVIAYLLPRICDIRRRRFGGARPVLGGCRPGGRVSRAGHPHLGPGGRRPDRHRGGRVGPGGFPRRSRRRRRGAGRPAAARRRATRPARRRSLKLLPEGEQHLAIPGQVPIDADVPEHVVAEAEER